MPAPKQQKAKKLTRKELLELQREEQRRKEEEEKQRQEEERLRQEELERLRQIELERLAAEERARLAEEEVDYEIQKSIFNENLTNAKKAMRMTEDWEKFLVCNLKPDPVRESELTTFISMYKDSKPVQNLKIGEALEQIQYAETIVQEIQQNIYNLKSDRKIVVNKMQQEDESIQRSQQYIERIRKTTLRKLDEITAHLVINTDTLMEEKMAELNKKMNEGPSKGYKQDDKHKQEIFKIFTPLKDFRYGIWINPNSKSGYRHKPIDFGELECQCEVPRTLMSTMLIMKVCWTGFDYLSPVQNYMKDIVIGGVLDIECLEFLPLPKKVNNWTLKMNYDFSEAIKKYSYPAVDSSGQVNYANVNPVKIFYTLPSYVWIHPNDKEKIRIGIFDKISNSWQTDQVDDIKVDLEKKLISFSTLRLSSVGYLQERCSDYPYEKWKLRCVANDKARLDIFTKRDVFKFEIHPGYITLIQRSDPEFSNLVDKKFEVGALFYELQRCGVNLMPVEEDAHTANIVSKDGGAEELAIKDISQAARSYYVESSRWNNSDTKETVVAKLKENLEFDEVRIIEFAENQEKDWKTFRWWYNKCAAIQARDSYSKCVTDLVGDTSTHCNLEVVLKTHNLASGEVLQKMKDLHFVIFIDTIAQVLRISKLLAFTVKD